MQTSNEPANDAVATMPRRVAALIAAVFVGFLAAMLGSVGQVAAQENSLNEIVPANGAALIEAPEEIVLSFNQPIDSDQIIQVVLQCTGQLQQLGEGEFNDEETAVTFPIASEIPRGACVIEWDLFNVDDSAEIASGRTTFSVDAEPGATTPATDAPDSTSTPATAVPATTVPSSITQDVDTSTPVVDADSEGSNSGALWLGGFISAIGIMVIFGALVVISTGWPEGPEYLVTLNFFRLVWVVSLVGTLVYVAAYAADYAGTGFIGGFNPLNWVDLVNDGWTGVGATLRLIAVVATGYVALHPERVIDPATAMWAWLIPGLAVVSLALTRVSGDFAMLGLIIGIVHVLASAVWIGGTALVARVVLAGPGEDDLVAATRTFARYSVAAIATSVVTGVIEMIRLDGGSLFSSSHGRVVLLKALFVGAMVFIGMAARQQVNQRLAQEYDMSIGNASRFRRAFGAETALGVVVLGLSGWLLALDTGSTVPWENEDYAREVVFDVPALELDATVHIGPATVGQNGFLVQVERPDDGITDLSLRFIPPTGTQNGEAFIIEQDIPLAGSGSVWRPTEAGIPLDVPGVWRLELSATTAAGIEPGTQMTFTVDNADGSEVTAPSTTATIETTPTNTQVIDETPVTGDIVVATTPPPSETTAPSSSTTPTSTP